MKNQEINKENKIIIGSAIVLAAAIIIFAMVDVGDKNKISENKGPGSYDKFAQCLTDRGAIMYGASWCSHCAAQKAAFNGSFKFIKYVECPDNTQLCIDKGVQGYPTWLIGTSTKLEGFDENRTMKDLSKATGCQLPQ